MDVTCPNTAALDPSLPLMTPQPHHWTERATRALQLALRFCVYRHQRTFGPRMGRSRRRDNGGAVAQRAQLQELRYSYPTSRLNVVNHGRKTWDANIYLTSPWLSLNSSLQSFPRSYKELSSVLHSPHLRCENLLIIMQVLFTSMASAMQDAVRQRALSSHQGTFRCKVY